MKIVHLCLGNNFIDGYSYQENLLPKYHVRQGHDVTVIASLVTYGLNGKITTLSEPSVHEERGYKVIRLAYKTSPSIKINQFLRRFEGLNEQLEKEQPDIIFSHNVQYADAIVVTNHVKRHSYVKLYADNHGDYINSGRNFLSLQIKHKLLWRYYATKLAHRAEKVWGVTPMRCDFLREVYKLDPNKIAFLPMGIDDESIPENRKQVRSEIRQLLGIPINAFVIVTGGKIDCRKNIHHLLNAVSDINIRQLHVIIFGTIMQDIQVEFKEHRDNPNIHFVGWSTAEEVMNYLVTSDLACFPGTHSSLWEQSVGSGLPCIFKDWGDRLRHVNVNGNCVFVQGEDEMELIQIIKNLLIPEQYDAICKKAQEASKSFLYSDIARRAIEA